MNKTSYFDGEGLMSTTEIVTCNGCGAPLPAAPSLTKPVKCEYCEITNVYHPPRIDAITGELVVSEEELAERDYQIYLQQQEILAHYPGELVGEEISKVRLALHVGPQLYQILVVLDNFPEEIFIEVSPDVRDLIGSINDLKTLRQWRPGESKAIDVIRELESKIKEASGIKDIQSNETETERKMMKTRGKTKEKKEKKFVEKDPLFLEIMKQFEAMPEKKGLKVIFYATDGEEKIIFIKRKKKYPIELKGRFPPLIEGIIDDYNKGRISLIQALSEIERAFYV